MNMLKHIKKLLRVDNSSWISSWLKFGASCKAIEALADRAMAMIHEVLDKSASEKVVVDLEHLIEILSSQYESLVAIPEPRRS